jgi:hypothetical protein
MGRNLYKNADPRALKEIATLVEATINGDRIRKEVLLERLGTTDGVFAFANLTNVQLQKNYRDTKTAIWNRISTRTVVNDFRTVQWLDFGDLDYSLMKASDKGVARPANVLPEVAEGEKYQSFKLSQSIVPGFSVKKYGGQIGFTWEAFVNDPYNTVRRIPQLFAKTAVNVLDSNATRALVVAAQAQPHLAATTAGNGLPAVTADSAFGLAPLIAALNQLRQKKDSHGNYITTGPLVLSIDPSLRATVDWVFAQQTQTTRSATGTGTNNYTETTAALNNFGNIEVVENRYLAYYTGNQTAWILSPAGGDNADAEDSIVTAFLAGEEEPEVRVTGLAGYTPNGNALPFTSGSFDNDTFDMRVRVVGGAGAVNALPIIYSAGTGALN